MNNNSEILREQSTPILHLARQLVSSGVPHLRDKGGSSATADYSKTPCCTAGFVNPRALLVFALCSAGLLLAMLSFAGTPSSVGLANQQPASLTPNAPAPEQHWEFGAGSMLPAPEAAIPPLTPTPTVTAGPAQ